MNITLSAKLGASGQHQNFKVKKQRTVCEMLKERDVEKIKVVKMKLSPEGRLTIQRLKVQSGKDIREIAASETYDHESMRKELTNLAEWIRKDDISEAIINQHQESVQADQVKKY